MDQTVPRWVSEVRIEMIVDAAISAGYINALAPSPIPDPGDGGNQILNPARFVNQVSGRP
jgi:hypothetical protein